MPAVPENERLDALRRLGLSGPLVRLAAGEPVRPAFGFRCQAPPRYSYRGAGCPDGPPLAPLWDCGDTVTAVWERDGRPEFIEFGIEADGEFRVLAATEWCLAPNSGSPAELVGDGRTILAGFT